MMDSLAAWMDIEKERSVISASKDCRLLRDTIVMKKGI